MLSAADDLPIHQTADVVRHPVTSDRNFYDRYYFNAHPGNDELFLIVGMGQYPNLGVADAFAAVIRKDDMRQHVVRASRALGDRLDASVGPFRVEVLDGLRRLRVVLEPTEHALSFDLTWTGTIPATLEPRHFLRVHDRVAFDSTRFAQTGSWEGQLVVDGTSYDVTPGSWGGARDRSWGIRPVGEPEPAGIRAARAAGSFYWLYAPMQLPDSTFVVITQEDADGNRQLEEAVRVWRDESRPAEHLGRPDVALTFHPGTREVARASFTFEHGPPVEVETRLPLNLGAGTGYGIEGDWRHGMWQGELVVQGRSYDLADPAARHALFCVTDSLARFTCEGQEGWGLFEFACFGPHVGTGFQGWDDVA